jgi:hypothetical protein
MEALAHPEHRANPIAHLAPLAQVRQEEKGATAVVAAPARVLGSMSRRAM